WNALGTSFAPGDALSRKRRRLTINPEKDRRTASRELPKIAGVSSPANRWTQMLFVSCTDALVRACQVRQGSAGYRRDPDPFRLPNNRRTGACAHAPRTSPQVFGRQRPHRPPHPPVGDVILGRWIAISAGLRRCLFALADHANRRVSAASADSPRAIPTH